MDIYTVRDNLKNTIKGKELLLKEREENFGSSIVNNVIRINLTELRAILADVEICCQNKTES